MITDNQLLFSDAQAVTAAAASTNYLDLSAVRYIGTGKTLYIVVVCVVTMTDDSSNSTLDIILYADSTTTFTPDAQYISAQFPAVSTAGTTRIIALDPDHPVHGYRYLELYYSPNNGNLTAGSFDAFVALDVHTFRAYADNITIQ